MSLDGPSQSEACWHQGPTFFYSFLGSKASQEAVTRLEFPTRPCILKSLNQEVVLAWDVCSC